MRRQFAIAQHTILDIGDQNDIGGLAVGVGSEHRGVGRRGVDSAEVAAEAEIVGIGHRLILEDQDQVVADRLLERQDLGG